MEDGDMVCGNCILEQVEPTFSVNALYVYSCELVVPTAECAVS